MLKQGVELALSEERLRDQFSILLFADGQRIFFCISHKVKKNKLCWL